MTTSASGNVVTVDARDVAVVDQRPLPAGTTNATVSFQLTWKGGGGRRRLAASTPAFAGQFFRRARARGTFAASEEGFAFASDSREARAQHLRGARDRAERRLPRGRDAVPAMRRALAAAAMAVALGCGGAAYHGEGP